MKKNILAIILVAVMFLTTGCSAKYSSFKEVKKYSTEIKNGNTLCDSIMHEFEKNMEPFPWNIKTTYKDIKSKKYDYNGKTVSLQYVSTTYEMGYTVDRYTYYNDSRDVNQIYLDERNGDLVYWKNGSSRLMPLEASEEEIAEIEKKAIAFAEDLAKNLPEENEYEITTGWSHTSHADMTVDLFYVSYKRSISSSFKVSDLTVEFDSQGEIRSYFISPRGFADNVDISIDEDKLQESIDSAVNDLFKKAGYTPDEVTVTSKYLMLVEKKLYVRADISAKVKETGDDVDFPTVTLVGKLK